MPARNTLYRMRFALLLSSPAVSETQRWQLVASLYDQVRSLIEGSIALFITLGVCFATTRWWGFSALAGTTTVVTVVRLVHWRGFAGARLGGRSPEAWARDYTIGICAMSLLWASTVVCVTFQARDMQLLLFVLLIQNAWLAGAGIRNAASPSAIMGQTLLTVLPTVVCLACGTSILVRLLAPSCFIFIPILLKIGRFYGAQMLSLMESEQRLAAANEKLLKLSCTDGLTGIPNRRAFDDRFAADWAFAVRGALGMTVVLVDVDYFKRYNDHYGHLAGDDCLRAIAASVAGSAMRASDLPARYGGEEFVVLLPGMGPEAGAEVAERLRGAVYDANLPHEASPLGRVTISVGVASVAPDVRQAPATLVTMADQALYKAKLLGRNQVCATPAAAAAIKATVAVPRAVRVQAYLDP